MSNLWTTVYQGTVGGREVNCQFCPQDGYKVTTTLAHDAPGSVEFYREFGQTLIIPPTAADTPINIEGETIPELRAELIDNGFDGPAADLIIKKFQERR